MWGVKQVMNQMGDKTLKPQQMLGQDLDKRGIWRV